MSNNSSAIVENKMGVMSIGKLLTSMAVPMMISMLVQALYNIVDSIFVSFISENALTAVSLAFPLQNLMIAFGAGTGVGLNALLSRELGAKKFDKVNKVANFGILIYTLTFLLFLVVGLSLPRLFMSTQTSNAEIIELGTQYIMICLGCSLGLFYQFCFERLLQSTGKTSLSMIAQIVGAVTNIIFDYLLIFGEFGFPKLGVAGAALATVIGQFLAALVALVLNIKFNKEIKLSFKLIRFNTAIFKEVYKVALPSIIMQSIGSIMTFTLNKILITFSTTATAIFGVYFKLQSFVFMPVFGLNNGMVPIISYNFGAKKPDRVKKTIKVAIASAVSIMLVGLAIFEIFPAQLLSMFNASPNMIEIGVPALRIIALHFILAGFSIISISVSQAIGNPLYSLIVSVCRQLFVLIPTAWALSLTRILDLVWFAFPIAELVAVAMSLFFLYKTMKNANKIMKSE